MMKEDLHLKWSELRTIEESLQIDNKSIVYLWLFEFDQELVPYYVGKHTGTLKGRIFEHFFHLVGGAYTIYHKDYLKEFYKYKYAKEDDILLYYPKAENIMRFYNNYEKLLKPHIDYLTKISRFTIAEVDPNLLVDVEKYLINLIGKSNLSNSRAGNYSIHKISYTGNKSIIKLLDLYDRINLRGK